MNEIIQYWFDNRIKTDGFDGNLSLNVKKFNLTEKKTRLLQIFYFFIFRIHRAKIFN